MMPKFGNTTNPSEDILKEIKTIGRMGFDFAEIGIEGPKAFPETLVRKKRKILKLLDKYGMFAIAHTAWFIDLGCPYENVRRAWVEEGKKAIDTARELGIKLVNFHFDCSTPLMLRDARIRRRILENHVRSLKELNEYGSGMKIMLENGAIQEWSSNAENLRYIMKKVKDIGFHLDVGHAFVHGGMKNVMKFLRIFRKRLVHIHMHDNYGVKDDHLPVGVANIDYEKIVKTLKRAGYDKTVSFEVFTKDRDFAKISMEKFRKMWTKTG